MGSYHSTETATDIIQNRNFVLLYVSSRKIHRMVYVLPRKAPLYEIVFGKVLHVDKLDKIIETSSDGDIVALFNNNSEEDLLGVVQDGGELIPSHLVQLITMSTIHNYSAANVTFMKTERDSEIINGEVSDDSSAESTNIDREYPIADTSSSILKMKGLN